MKLQILSILTLMMSLNLFAQDETINGNLIVNNSLKLGGTGEKIYWDWPNRTIEQYSSDGGTSRMIRFRNSMGIGQGNVDGGFDFSDYIGRSVLRINNHTVGIGTTDTKGFKLGVNGKIVATEVKVATYGNWVGLCVF